MSDLLIALRNITIGLLTLVIGFSVVALIFAFFKYVVFGFIGLIFLGMFLSAMHAVGEDIWDTYKRSKK